MSNAGDIKVGDDVAIRTTVSSLDREGLVGFRIVGSDEIIWAEKQNVRGLRPITSDKLPITITRDEDRYFAVEAAGRRARGLCFDEMLGAVVGLAHPDVAKVPVYMRGAGSEEVRPHEGAVMITLPLATAEALSAGMADLLCWCRGYLAAIDDTDKHPMGVSKTRDMRILLESAIAAAKGEDPVEMPF